MARLRWLGSVGDHLDRNAAHALEDTGGQTRVTVFHASHDANDRVAALDFDRTQRAQVANDLVDVAVVVDGQRDGDFDVVIMSIGVRYCSKISNTLRRKPYAISMRAEWMRMTRDAVFGRDGVERLRVVVAGSISSCREPRGPSCS